MSFEPSAAQLALKPGDPVWYSRVDGGSSQHFVGDRSPRLIGGGFWGITLIGFRGWVDLERVTPRVVSLHTLLSQAQKALRKIDDYLEDCPEEDPPIERMRSAIRSALDQIEERIARGES